MEKNSATGPDRTGVRWFLLIPNSELRSHPDFSGLELFALIIRKLAAEKFSSDINHLISAANLIAHDKGVAKIRPIAFGAVVGRFITNFLISASI